MKKLKWIFLPTMLAAILLLLVVSCRESFVQEPISDLSTNTEEMIKWNDLLNQFDLSRDIIIVQKEESIQEAVDAAKPGDAIYIEPGTYREALKINKDNIKLIGLTGPANEKVIIENPGGVQKCVSTTNGKNVEIVNIVPKNFSDAGLKITQKCMPNPVGKSRLLNMKRSELPGGIAHYEFELRMGDGPFDVVGIHRVVKEYKPYHSVKTNGDIFMVHGGIMDFNSNFLIAGATNINAKTSSPVYLASKNIDVWGIDLGWTKVPVETTDFSFMKGWGVEKDINHTLAAMSFSRLVRGISSQNYDKMNLLAFANLVTICYGAAGKETQIPSCLHNIKGLIPIDEELICSDEEWVHAFREETCNSAEVYKEMIENGIYQDNLGTTFNYFAELALTEPEAKSPIFEGMTNYEAIMVIGTMTSPNQHFVGGNLNGLFYSDLTRFINGLYSLKPYQPAQEFYEYAVCSCNKENVVSFDDYVGNIKLPIFYIGAGGGVGAVGIYSTTLTSSTDITTLVVSVTDDKSVDYGIADLNMGNNSDKLVWEPLRKWLVDHN
ncbi:MAG: hypothetical protein U0W24_11965 [Bacteroidales bacterium]